MIQGDNVMLFSIHTTKTWVYTLYTEHVLPACVTDNTSHHMVPENKSSTTPHKVGIIMWLETNKICIGP
jgi:hypothetical protein